MRADRLLSLLMLLQVNGQMTAGQLAERLEVSERTIYRDLDALSSAGVPVYTERGPGGGCALLDSYRTTLTGLKEDEVQALFMLTISGLLADLGVEQAAERAHLKLLAALPASFQQQAQRVQERLYLDPAGWFRHDESVPYLSLLQQAVWQEGRLRLHYRMADGTWTWAIADPYGLVAKAGIWYLVGGTPRGIRVYRVSRIQEAEPTGQTFERPPDFRLRAYWEQWSARFEARQETYTVHIRVAPGGERLLVESLGEGVYSLLSGANLDGTGYVSLSLTFASAEDACRRLLGLAPLVEVMEPAGLRRRLAQTAAAARRLYADGAGS